jgi:hypothetical protein
MLKIFALRSMFFGNPEIQRVGKIWFGTGFIQKKMS